MVCSLAEQRLHQLGETRLVVDDEQATHGCTRSPALMTPVGCQERRQRNHHLGALARRRVDLEPPAVLVDDAAADAEPEPAAALLGGEEGLAQARAPPRRPCPRRDRRRG